MIYPAANQDAHYESVDLSVVDSVSLTDPVAVALEAQIPKRGVTAAGPGSSIYRMCAARSSGKSSRRV